MYFSPSAYRHSSSIEAEEGGHEEAEKEAKEDAEEADDAAVEEAKDASDEAAKEEAAEEAKDANDEETPEEAAKEAEAAMRKARRTLRTNMVRHMVAGARVVRGIDWKWRDQDNPR